MPTDQERAALETDAARGRLRQMNLTDSERNSVFAFLCGWTPDGIHTALDMVQRYRDDDAASARRAAHLLEA